MKKHLFFFIIFLCPLILFSQNVGVGTDSPAAKLTIKGNYSDPLIPGTTSNGLLRIGPSLNEGLDIGKSFNGAFDIWLQAGFGGTPDPISLQPLGGNVGIGLLSPSEKLEVAGNVKVAGIISGVSDPILAQDAATKAYVDLLESTVALLEAKVTVLSNFLNLTVQQRLNSGETPIEIYNSDNSLLDSLYGKTYHGGLITYFDTTTGTGLIAAAVDQSTGAEWGCNGNEIGGTSCLIGTGQANTTLIVDGCAESGIAARLCDELVVGVYDDWILPSKDELNEIYLNLKMNGFGGLSDEFYWCSTEIDNFIARGQSFFSGAQNVDSKTGNRSVRAVRAF